MKKIAGVIIAGVVVCIIAGYYFIIYCPKADKNKELMLSECITDIIKLKSGNVIMGKVIKETSDSVLIRTADGTMEISTLKKQIASMRRATADDVKFARDEMARASKAAREAVRYERERAARLKEYYEKRNAREIAAASTGGSQSGSIDAIKDAKNKGQVVSGMNENDVIEILGQPDNIERDDRNKARGSAERMKWCYSTGVKKCGVTFYKGRVE